MSIKERFRYWSFLPRIHRGSRRTNNQPLGATYYLLCTPGISSPTCAVHIKKYVCTRFAPYFLVSTLPVYPAASQNWHKDTHPYQWSELMTLIQHQLKIWQQQKKHMNQNSLYIRGYNVLSFMKFNKLPLDSLGTGGITSTAGCQRVAWYILGPGISAVGRGCLCLSQVATSAVGPLPASCPQPDTHRVWSSCQMCKIAGCACAGNAGNVFPSTDFEGNR